MTTKRISDRDPGLFAVEAIRISLTDICGDLVDPVGNVIPQIAALADAIVASSRSSDINDDTIATLGLLIQSRLDHLHQAHTAMTDAFRARIAALEEELDGFADYADGSAVSQ